MAVPAGVRRALLAALWLGALVIAAKLMLHHMVTMPTGRSWNDSYVDLGAASNFVDHPGQLYDDAHAQLSRSWAQRAFVHPPSALLPYFPLVPVVRLAGLPVAASIWAIIDALALFAGLILFGRRVGASWLMLGVAVLLISLSSPVRWEISSGQINGVMLLLLTLSVLRMPRTDSGVLMGLALAVKPVSAIVLLVPLLRRRPAITVAAVVTLVTVNLPFVPLLGMAATLFYVGRVLPFFAGYAVHDPNNIALPNVLQTWLGGGPLPRHGLFSTPVPRALNALAVLWGARIAVILVWVRASLDRNVDVATAVALAMATVPILSSTIWPHYLVYLLPLTLVTLAAPRLWVRAAGTLSLFAMLWPWRSDGLWIAIATLWVAATVLLVSKLDWRLPVSADRPQPVRLRPGT
jgi:hypothetical protein